jgi:hypothetical protein
MGRALPAPRPLPLRRRRRLGDVNAGQAGASNDPWYYWLTGQAEADALASAAGLPPTLDQTIAQCVQDNITASGGTMTAQQANALCSGVQTQVYDSTPTPSLQAVIGPYVPSLTGGPGTGSSSSSGGGVLAALFNWLTGSGGSSNGAPAGLSVTGAVVVAALAVGGLVLVKEL